MRAPKCPYELGDAGRAWWRWAWRSPQAQRWDPGVMYTVARRAKLEDDLAALEAIEVLDVDELLAHDDPAEILQQLGWLLRSMKRAAAGVVVVSREMGKLEEQLGFGARSMHQLNWKPEAEPAAPSRVDEIRAQRDKRLERASAAD